jgi:hypothetical protein
MVLASHNREKNCREKTAGVLDISESKLVETGLAPDYADRR